MQNKIVKVEIITRSNKFEDLKEALSDIGITGMTITQVLGYGNQKGSTEYYRGVPYEINLMPKVKIEIVTDEDLVDTIVKTSRRVLSTGKVGDGKIFVYDIMNAIRIRTGEEGKDAL
ncbi:P-II family nitrogen regulator [Clostridium brassicae]|uniref:P-II family nitrogen regulator n=1 Tax=Clostridium brassicae TaxID=2999072 RepID=UPI002DD64DED|nr:P-II family nitrogen regulator [Clostridium brassicae]